MADNFVIKRRMTGVAADTGKMFKIVMENVTESAPPGGGGAGDEAKQA